MKSILMIFRRFYPHIGGIESQGELLAKEFCEKGYKVVILTQRYDKELHFYEKYGDIEIHRFSNYFHYVYMLIKLRFAYTFQFIMSHQLLEESCLLGILKFLKVINIPIIGCTHSGGEKSEIMKIVRTFSLMKMYTLIYFFIFQFEYINCLNKDIKIQLEEYIIKGNTHKRKKLIFIPNGIKIPKNFIFPKKKKKVTNFLYLGRFEREKGIFETIRAFRQLPQRDIVLNIIGYGDINIEKEIKTLIAGDERIHFVGKKIGKEKEKILAITDVSVSPSSYSEGQPMTLLEFALHNIVMITTKVGNNFEIYGNSVMYVQEKHVGDLIQKMQFIIENIEQFEYDYTKILEQLHIDKIVDNYLCLFSKK